MSVEEYKKQIVSLVEEMEKEHGLDISSIEIRPNFFSENGFKIYRVYINT